MGYRCARPCFSLPTPVSPSFVLSGTRAIPYHHFSVPHFSTFFGCLRCRGLASTESTYQTIPYFPGTIAELLACFWYSMSRSIHPSTISRCGLKSCASTRTRTSSSYPSETRRTLTGSVSSLPKWPNLLPVRFLPSSDFFAMNPQRPR